LIARPFPWFSQPDFVLISHSHYDHLCSASVAALRAHFGEGRSGAAASSSAPLHWYVPLGLADWFRSAGVTAVTELDWWQEARHAGAGGKGGGGVRVACTPAQHWSQRTPWDAMSTLWSSWAVLGPRRRFWFGGDTGCAPQAAPPAQQGLCSLCIPPPKPSYCAVFKEIGAKYGPFDLAAVPVAAYEPRWFHRPAHLDPADAVQVHLDVKSNASVAVHCCTWSLTDEALDEPPRELARAAAAAGLQEGAFVTMQHGATLAVGAAETATAEAGAPEEGAQAAEPAARAAASA
jgi:N-acyl-phosphatidylethanolamine-hydrolysing phospholipase D